jgi:tetratricopeptide (TPR) repeat protein
MNDSESTNYRNEIIIGLFLVIITFSVYWQIQRFDFVHFDDNEYVYDNQHVNNGISSDNLIWAFTAFHSNNWHPLTWISHMLDCQFFGLNPGWHHLTNLLFHIANILLLYIIFRQTTGSIWKSGFIAAIFALHPLHVESVAWIAERKDVLSAFFWMLTLWSYIRYTRRPAFNRYLWVIIFFIFGLMSKPMVVTLPFVLLLMDYWPLNRVQFQSLDAKETKAQVIRLLVEKIPLFIFIPISSIFTYFAQNHGGIVKSLDVFPLETRIANAIVSYIRYIEKMIYPTKMAFLHPHQGMPSWWMTAGSCLLVIAISFLAVKNINKRPYLIVGWLWYIGTLVPVIGLVQVGMQSMADRYTYIPSIGLLIIVAFGISEMTSNWRYQKLWLSITTTALITIFSAITWNQLGYWKNSMTMLAHTLKVTSNNYIAYDSMGVELFGLGRVDEAIQNYLKAIEIYPQNPYSHFNLGMALHAQGRLKEASQQYLQAIRIMPAYYKAYTNLGAALYAQGQTDEAIKQYLKALRINPDYVEAHYNLGLALDTAGRTEDAINHFMQAVRVKPDLVTAQYSLGTALYKQGRTDEAIGHFLKAVRLKPDLLIAQYSLGIALAKQGRIDEAIDCYNKALALKNDYAEAHTSLGNALYQKGQIDEAIRHYLQAVRINPNYAEAYGNLGSALFLKGDVDKAVVYLQEALRIKPDYANARNNLEKIQTMQQQHK